MPDAASAHSPYEYSPEEHLNHLVMGHGPHTIVLLHGFAASLHTWDDIAPLFPQEEYTLHLLDLKGHGDSSKQPGDYSALHNARLVTNYLRSRNLTDVTLIGHSYGGAVALLTALGCTADINRLILIGTPGFPQDVPPFMRILGIPIIGPLLMNAVPANRVALSALKHAFHRHELITGQLVERYAAAYRRKGAATALSYTVRQILPANVAHLTAGYADLAIPVLLLWGEHDRIVGRWQGERLHKELPGSRLATIPDCGHNPHEERPHETFALIREFLSSRKP